MKKPSWSLQDTGRIYLDHNATTPPLKSVVDSLVTWASFWGNPSSIHWSGRGPKNIIREARQALARALKAHPLEIIFTSGGSESNNLILKGFFENQQDPARNEYITTTVEHPSVLKSFEYLESRGARVHYLKVNRQGILDLETYSKILTPQVALVSVMAANNETGSIFPVKEMAEMAHKVGAKFHTDAVQMLGKLPIDLNDWNVDYASFAGHKTYSLKGAGFVFVKKGQRLHSLIAGGGQERGRRAGTENILPIVSLGHVAKHLAEIEQIQSTQTQNLRNELEREIQNRIERVQWTGAGTSRLPNTTSLLIDGIDGESLLMNLDIEGVSVSTGAACSSGNPEPSPVLLAMGLSRAEAQRSLRLSLGLDTTREELDQFLNILEKVVLRLRTRNNKEVSHVESL